MEEMLSQLMNQATAAGAPMTAGAALKAVAP
jgi:hypothetical protein